MIRSLLIAKEIREENNLMEIFYDPPHVVWEKIQGSQIHEKIQNYLLKFGERCLGELKLETVSYNQAPENS